MGTFLTRLDTPFSIISITLGSNCILDAFHLYRTTRAGSHVRQLQLNSTGY